MVCSLTGFLNYRLSRMLLQSLYNPQSRSMSIRRVFASLYCSCPSIVNSTRSIPLVSSLTCTVNLISRTLICCFPSCNFLIIVFSLRTHRNADANESIWARTHGSWTKTSTSFILFNKSCISFFESQGNTFSSSAFADLIAFKFYYTSASVYTCKLSVTQSYC